MSGLFVVVGSHEQRRDTESSLILLLYGLSTHNILGVSGPKQWFLKYQEHQSYSPLQYRSTGGVDQYRIGWGWRHNGTAATALRSPRRPEHIKLAR